MPTTDSLSFTIMRQWLIERVYKVARHVRRVRVEKHGIPVAAIVSPEDLKRLAALDHEEQARVTAFRIISDRLADTPLDELEQEAAHSVASARYGRASCPA
ncbi:MAG TPA: hypothetical protein VD789_09250 [Thermomicrobiales bacterium]|nr:hypothetical protein [Thermomicrobiales bacterium]